MSVIDNADSILGRTMNMPTPSASEWTAAQLRAVVAQLDEAQPRTDTYERGIHIGPDGSRATWYRSQKEHLLGWLGDYGGPGAYARKNPGRDARFFYNHFRCPEGLMWLAEALGEDPTRLTSAMEAVRAAAPNPSSRCAAFRRVIGWDRIAELVEAHRPERPPLLCRLRSAVSRLRPG